MPIHILPAEIASQIAAGEVVERPASVVKELVENALDAGAKQISIKIIEAGKRLIEISDDGCGIPASELALSVERHATSKLVEAADLFRITSLGFRGEALASIASISRLTLTSRQAGSSAGSRIRVEGGISGKHEPVGAPFGTLVQVEDLFYNVPARLKFLKQDITERNQIDHLVTRYALAYPDVRVHLSHEEHFTLQTSGSGDRRSVLALIYGPEIARQMLEITYREENLSVAGFISPISITRSNRSGLVFFVNGRPVQEPALSAAVMKGYQTLLMVGRFPMAIIFLKIPPEEVDVNVHPTKAEVRFRGADRIFSGVQNAVRRGLLAHNPVPDLDPRWRWNTQPRPTFSGLDWRMANQDLPAADAYNAQETASAGDLIPQQGDAQPDFPSTRIPLLRLVGQIANAYLVAEAPDGLYLVDQHAAHERVLFERFMQQNTELIPSQSLLQPASVELGPPAARLLEEQLPAMKKLGFVVEPFGPNTFLVRALPALLQKLDPEAALRVLVEDFEEDEKPLGEETEARLVARVCKRAAVKAGQSLSTEEGRNLLTDLEACQSPRTCPHGRPTMIYLSVDLLERQFGRRGAR